MNKSDWSRFFSACDVRRRQQRSPATLAYALAVCLFALSGCSKPIEVRKYEVDKPPHRMLAAIVPREEQKTAWFFKLSGPRQAVAANVDGFQKLLASVEFVAAADSTAKEDAAKDGPAKDAKSEAATDKEKPRAGGGEVPKWTLPAGWKQVPGATGERFATIEVPGGDKPLELTVTRLPMPTRGVADYKLQNINRWRQQLKLGPITIGQLASQANELSAAGGAEVTWVDFVGTLAPARRPMEGGGPFAMGMGGGMGGAMGGGTGPMGGDGMLGGGAAGAPASVPFDYQAPAEWAQGPTNSLRRLSYKVDDGGEQAEITVIVLPADANDLLSNINRWRDQVGLAAVDAEGLKSIVKPLDMGGVPGAYVELVGAGEPGRRESILGVMAVQDDMAWFFKFKGPDSLAQREKERFEAFVKSVRFHGS